MTTLGVSATRGLAGARCVGEVTAQRPVLVRSCNRLGRVANPPKLSFTDWLLFGRRR